MQRLMSVLLLMTLMGFLLFLFYLSFVPHADAKGDDGDPSLCGQDWSSESQKFSKDAIHERLIVTSECQRLSVDEFVDHTVIPPHVRAEWKMDLWDSDHPIVAYRYKLEVLND